MQLQHVDGTLAEIAGVRDVDAALQGSTTRSGSQVQVAVRLVRVTPEQEDWSGAYDGNLTDL